MDKLAYGLGVRESVGKIGSETSTVGTGTDVNVSAGVEAIDFVGVVGIAVTPLDSAAKIFVELGSIGGIVIGEVKEGSSRKVQAE